MRELSIDLLSELLDKYGQDEQLRQAQGECGELIAVIQNYHRAEKYGHRSEKLADVMSEAVDVYFMIQQIMVMDITMFNQMCLLKELKVLRKLDTEKPKRKKRTIK